MTEEKMILKNTTGKDRGKEEIHIGIIEMIRDLEQDQGIDILEKREYPVEGLGEILKKELKAEKKIEVKKSIEGEVLEEIKLTIVKKD